MSQETEQYSWAVKAQAEGNQRGLVAVSKRILAANPAHLPTWRLLHQELGNGQDLYTFIEGWGQANLPQVNAHLLPHQAAAHPAAPPPAAGQMLEPEDTQPLRRPAPPAPPSAVFARVQQAAAPEPSFSSGEELERHIRQQFEVDFQPATAPLSGAGAASRTMPPAPIPPAEPDWMNLLESAPTPALAVPPPPPAPAEPDWLDMLEVAPPRQPAPRPARPSARQPQPGADFDAESRSLLEQAAHARAASDEKTFERALIRLIDRETGNLPGLARYRLSQPVNSPAWETAEEILCRIMNVPTREMIQKAGNLPRIARIMLVVGFVVGIVVGIAVAEPSVALFVPFILSFLLWMLTWINGTPLSREGGSGRVLILLMPFAAISRSSQHHSILNEWKEARRVYEQALKELSTQPAGTGGAAAAAAPATLQPRTYRPALDIHVARHGPFSYGYESNSRYSLSLKTERLAWMVQYERQEKGNILAEIFPPHIEPKIIKKQFPSGDQAWYIFEQLPRTSKEENKVRIWRGTQTEVGVLIFINKPYLLPEFWLQAPRLGLDGAFITQAIAPHTLGLFTNLSKILEPLYGVSFSADSPGRELQRNHQFDEMPPDVEELLLMITFYLTPKLSNPR